MLRDVVAVQPLPEYRLSITFDDGVQGVVNVREMVQFTGVFQPLRDPAFFTQVKVNSELGTVCWPNDADLDSDVLYAKVTDGTSSGVHHRKEMTDGQSAYFCGRVGASVHPTIAKHDDEDRFAECHSERHRGGKICKWREPGESV